MKAVITVIGKDCVGIIYNVTKILCECNINILDISQTIMEGYFTMIMLTDLSKSNIELSEIKNLLEIYSNNSLLEIRIQHEDIFNAMHRV